jgi:hypothetical protein
LFGQRRGLDFENNPSSDCSPAFSFTSSETPHHSFFRTKVICVGHILSVLAGDRLAVLADLLV